MSISDIMDGGFKKINSNAQDKHNNMFLKPGHRRSQSDNTHVEYKLSESKRERSHYFNHSHRKQINQLNYKELNTMRENPILREKDIIQQNEKEFNKTLAKRKQNEK